MYNFDKEAYFTDAKLTYDTRGEIERVADEVSKQGFKNIFFISSGGSLAVMQPIQYLLRSKSAIPTYCEIASEVILTDNKQLTKDSIVITSSKSGTTSETVEAIEFCNKKGIRVIAFCGKPDTPVDQLATYSIIGKAKDAVEFEYIQHYLLAFRLLFNNGEFDAYNRLADQLEKLPENLVAVKEQFEPTAARIAETYYNSGIQYWIGGGSLAPEIYLHAMCILEEMQWIRTKSIKSAEFFHGTLEVIVKDTPVFLVKGVDETRPIDNRVERLIKKLSDHAEVIDVSDYSCPDIDEEFMDIIATSIVTTILDERLAVHYERVTGHDLTTRRYYRKFAY